MKTWAVPDADVCPRVLLAPKMAGFDSIDKQREIFRHALDSCWRQGGWTIVLDELRYFTDNLGLRAEVELILMQGRSEHVTLVGGAQRPRHVPLLVYDQAKHIFIGHDNDAQNVKRLAEIGGGINGRQIAEAVLPQLERHEFLYINAHPPISMERVKVEL